MEKKYVEREQRDVLVLEIPIYRAGKQMKIELPLGYTKILCR